MDKIKFYALILNLIIYIIMLLPIVVISFKENIYISKKNFISALIYSIIIQIVISAILYMFPQKIFSLFTHISGIINYATYISKILFITSSLYSLKVLIPAYMVRKNKEKKVAILVTTKIAITLLFILTGNYIFNTNGILFTIPLCDFLFYIIYLLNIFCYNF